MEMGNMIFGNSRGEFPVDRTDRMIAPLVRLFETLAPDDDDYNSYGPETVAEAFEIHPYYWGDCTCGFEDKCDAWSKEHDHTAACFYTRYHAEDDRLRDDMGWDRRNDHMVAWAKANGHPEAPDGMAVHCDCGHDEKWATWVADKDHDEKCPIVVPNFWHKPSGFKLKWYKYPLRDSYANQPITPKRLDRIVDHCIATLSNPATPWIEASK